mmetsp:Transcript_8739/g.26352  ORF Transcript_8739/g.26352 Transcript_8739/m.26352 type:complete len:246 (+) Transcript_8739:55-792(+)
MVSPVASACQRTHHARNACPSALISAMNAQSTTLVPKQQATEPGNPSQDRTPPPHSFPAAGPSAGMRQPLKTATSESSFAILCKIVLGLLEPPGSSEAIQVGWSRTLTGEQTALASPDPEGSRDFCRDRTSASRHPRRATSDGGGPSPTGAVPATRLDSTSRRTSPSISAIHSKSEGFTSTTTFPAASPSSSSTTISLVVQKGLSGSVSRSVPCEYIVFSSERSDCLYPDDLAPPSFHLSICWDW